MPFVVGPEEIPEKIKDIGVDFGVAARFTSNSQRFSQWIETPKSNHAHAQVHGWTPQLPWLDSATSMDGLRNFHGWAPQLPWMGSATSMVGLRNFHGSAARLAWFSFCASIHQLLNPVFDPENPALRGIAANLPRPRFMRHIQNDGGTSLVLASHEADGSAAPSMTIAVEERGTIRTRPMIFRHKHLPKRVRAKFYHSRPISIHMLVCFLMQPCRMKSLNKETKTILFSRRRRVLSSSGTIRG